MAPTAFFVNIYYLIIVLGCILSTPSFVVIVLKLLVFLLALKDNTITNFADVIQYMKSHYREGANVESIISVSVLSDDDFEIVYQENGKVPFGNCTMRIGFSVRNLRQNASATNTLMVVDHGCQTAAVKPLRKRNRNP